MRKFKINVNGKAYEVDVEEINGTAPTAVAPIVAPAQTPSVAAATPAPTPTAPVAPAVPQTTPAPAGSTIVSSPMPGTILSLNVNIGDSVTKGQVLLILEAMKMENEIMAPSSGKVVAVNTSKGATVNTGDALVSLA